MAPSGKWCPLALERQTHTHTHTHAGATARHYFAMVHTHTESLRFAGLLRITSFTSDSFPLTFPFTGNLRCCVLQCGSVAVHAALHYIFNKTNIDTERQKKKEAAE